MRIKFELQINADHITTVEKEFVPADYQSEFEAVVEQIAYALLACTYPEDLIKEYINYE